MPTPSPEIIQLISVFAIAFTAPTFKNMLVLTYGAILTYGRRTVAAALRVMGLEDNPDFGKYRRVLSREPVAAVVVEPGAAWRNYFAVSSRRSTADLP